MKKLNPNELELLSDLIDDTVFKFLTRRQERRMDKSMDAAAIHDAIPEVLKRLEEHRKWVESLSEEDRHAFLFEGHIPVQEFNKHYPVDTPVHYYPIAGEPEFEETRTRSEAWELGSGHAVVKVKGHTGGVSINHIRHAEGFTTPLYWDCNCETNYIRLKPQRKCDKCGVVRDERPDSHINEVRKHGLSLDETAELFNRLKPVMTRLENDAYNIGLRMINGGFSRCDLKEVNWEEHRVYLQLTYGVQSDVEDRYNVDNIVLDLYTLEEIN